MANDPQTTHQHPMEGPGSIPGAEATSARKDVTGSTPVAGTKSQTTRIERGWGGHFICANRCRFRRNTLLCRGKKKIVVSTVGSMVIERDGKSKLETIGAFGRYYETMAFEARKEDAYWEACVSKQLSFDADWALVWENEKDIPPDADLKADAMHEVVVQEFMGMNTWPTSKQ